MVWFADQMPRRGHRPGNLRTLANEAANHEEGGANPMLCQHFQQPKRIGIVGAVVVGQGNLSVSV